MAGSRPIVNHEDRQYSKRLIDAICNRDKKLSAEMIQKGTPDQLYCPETTGSKKTPLHHAIIVGDRESTAALINKDGVTAKQLFQQEKLFGRTPLHETIACGDVDNSLSIINKRGVTPKQLALTDSGGTPLDLANKKKMPKVVVAISNILFKDSSHNLSPVQHQLGLGR